MNEKPGIEGSIFLLSILFICQLKLTQIEPKSRERDLNARAPIGGIFVNRYNSKKMGGK